MCITWHVRNQTEETGSFPLLVPKRCCPRKEHAAGLRNGF